MQLILGKRMKVLGTKLEQVKKMTLHESHHSLREQAARYFPKVEPVVKYRLEHGEGTPSYEELCPPLEKIIRAKHDGQRENAGDFQAFSIRDAFEDARPGPYDADAQKKWRSNLLTQKENQVFYLHFVSRLSHTEIAKIVHVKESNAAQIFHRAKKKLLNGEEANSRKALS